MNTSLSDKMILGAETGPKPSNPATQRVPARCSTYIRNVDNLLAYEESQAQAAEKPSPPAPRTEMPLGFSLTPGANTVSLSDFTLLNVIGKGGYGKVCF